MDDRGAGFRCAVGTVRQTESVAILRHQAPHVPLRAAVHSTHLRTGRSAPACLAGTRRRCPRLCTCPSLPEGARRSRCSTACPGVGGASGASQRDTCYTQGRDHMAESGFPQNIKGHVSLHISMSGCAGRAAPQAHLRLAAQQLRQELMSRVFRGECLSVEVEIHPLSRA